MNKTIPEQVSELLKQGYTLQEAIDTVTRNNDCVKCNKETANANKKGLRKKNN